MRLRIKAHKGWAVRWCWKGMTSSWGKGRHSRDRVFHPDPPVDRRRARPRPAQPPHGRRAGTHWPQKGWIPKDVAEKLTAHYIEHREIEHRLQMVQDAQNRNPCPHPRRDRPDRALHGRGPDAGIPRPAGIAPETCGRVDRRVLRPRQHRRGRTGPVGCRRKT
jgi:hypothetical protein